MTFYGKIFKVICISDVILDSKTNEWNFCRKKIKLSIKSKFSYRQNAPREELCENNIENLKKKTADSIETFLFLLRVFIVRHKT